MPSDTQERLTPGQTFVDAAGQRRWKSRVPGTPNVEADAFEEEVQDTLLSAAPPSFTLEDLPATRPPSQEALTALRGLYARTGRALPETLRPTELETARAEDPFAGATPRFTLEPVSEASPAPVKALSPAAKATPRPSVSQVPPTATLREYSRDPAVYAEANMLPPLSEAQQARPLSEAAFAAETERARRLMAEDAASVSTPIPVNLASPRSDTAPVKSEAIAPSGPTTPAPPADTAAKAGLPAPQTEGAGGDVSERDLYLARLAAQSAAGFGGMGAGKSIDMGIADMLGERLKQVQALRAKREEQALVDEKERANNRAQVEYLMKRFPERAKDLEGLLSLTGKPNFSQMLRVEEQIALDQARKATEEAKPGFKEREVTVKEAESGSKDWKREQDIALGWARLNAQAAQAAQKAAQDLANAGASRAEQKDIDNQLENIQKIVKGGSYTPLIASLEQADKAIADLGAPPSAAAQMKHALPGGDRFLSPQEKAYYTSVDKLRQMDQLAVSGKVVSEPERAEFLRQYGANWYASPKAAAAYIDMLRAKTANQLNSDLATVRASPSGQKALAAYERQPGAVTPMHPVFKGAATTTRQAKPTEAPAGKTILWNVAEKKWKAVPTENADAAVGSGKYER